MISHENFKKNLKVNMLDFEAGEKKSVQSVLGIGTCMSFLYAFQLAFCESRKIGEKFFDVA